MKTFGSLIFNHWTVLSEYLFTLLQMDIKPTLISTDVFFISASEPFYPLITTVGFKLAHFIFPYSDPISYLHLIHTSTRTFNLFIYVWWVWSVLSIHSWLLWFLYCRRKKIKNQMSRFPWSWVCEYKWISSIRNTWNPFNWSGGFFFSHHFQLMVQALSCPS